MAVITKIGQNWQCHSVLTRSGFRFAFNWNHQHGSVRPDNGPVIQRLGLRPHRYSAVIHPARPIWSRGAQTRVSSAGAGAGEAALAEAEAHCNRRHTFLSNSNNTPFRSCPVDKHTMPVQPAAASTAAISRISSPSKKKGNQSDAVLIFEKLPPKKELEGDLEASIKAQG